MKSKGASFENYQIEQKRYDMESREKTGKPTKISPGGLFSACTVELFFYRYLATIIILVVCNTPLFFA